MDQAGVALYHLSLIHISTRTDTMLLERQRGITIQAAVTSFQWHRCKVNIVDTQMCIRDSI